MKKIVSLVLALLMLCMLPVFTGCGSNKSDKVFRVGMECAYAPYNWTQSTDANGAVKIDGTDQYAYGYDVIMAKEIAAELGCELQIFQIDWDTLPLALQAGKIDAVIAGQSITAEREELVDFTTPYFYASLVVLVKTDGKYANAATVADLKGAKCTSQVNTVWYDVCLPQIPDADIQTATESAPAMIVNLTSGNVDLVCTDMPTAMAAVAVNKNLKLINLTGVTGGFEVSDEEVNLGISVKEGNTELREKINAALAKMTVADFEAKMQDAISKQPLSVG